MTAQLPSREMLAQAIERISDAIDDAARLYGENWDSALVGGEPNYHAITSDHTQGIVVKTDDDSLHSSWLCDYLEAVDPASIRLLLARIKELDKAAHEQEPVAMRWRWKDDGWNGPGEWIYHDAKYFNDLSSSLTRVCELVYTHPAPVPAVPDELIRCLGFFASVIKSGESWTSACQHEYDTAKEACRAALQSGNSWQPVTVPAGYVLVPEKPTQEMVWAAKNELKHTVGWDSFVELYKAMLAAAPKVTP